MFMHGNLMKENNSPFIIFLCIFAPKYKLNSNV